MFIILGHNETIENVDTRRKIQEYKENIIQYAKEINQYNCIRIVLNQLKPNLEDTENSCITIYVSINGKNNITIHDDKKL